MTLVETKLAELGYELPQPPDPIGAYLPMTRSGNIMWMAGVGSRRANGEHIAGKLGADLTLEQGYEAARWAALNLLARMKAELGDLDRVTRILKVVGMVNSDPAFTDQAAVVDGASDLFVALYGERGQHARSAPGMAVLPGNTAVICDCVIEVDGAITQPQQRIDRQRNVRSFPFSQFAFSQRTKRKSIPLSSWLWDARGTPASCVPGCFGSSTFISVYLRGSDSAWMSPPCSRTTS